MSGVHTRYSLLLTIVAIAICGSLHAADNAVQVVPESDLKQWWVPPPGRQEATPRYPIDAMKSGVQGCVAVAFEIHADGSVPNERVWHSNLTYPSKEVEQAALIYVHQWRYVPARANANRVPVYTYAVVTFTLSNGEKWTKYDRERNDENKAKCEMTDFPQQVQAMIDSSQAGKKP